MIASLLVLLVVALPPDSPTAAPRDTLATPADSLRAEPRPILTLPEIGVDRDRVLTDAQRTSPTGFVSDLRAGETGHAFETIAELLSRSVAVRIQQYGGLGSFVTVSLRGAPANQLAVYLDGVPLNTAGQAIVNLSDLPVTSIDHLEVFRGLSPLALGPSTPGGAINIVTLPATALSHVSIQRGSFGTWQGVGTAGVRHGAWSALAHAGYQGARGDFGYHDDNGTPFNPADDAPSVRQNNHFDGRTLLGTIRGRLPLELRLTLRQSLFRKEQGVPGLGAVPAQATHLSLQRWFSVLELQRPLTRWVPALTAHVSEDHSRSRFADRLGELGGGISDTDDRLRGGQLRLTAESPRFARRVTLAASALLRRERADLRDAAYGRADPPESRRDTRGASAEVRVEPWPGHLMLRAGRRWDHQHDALRWTSPLGIASRKDVTRQLDAPQLGAVAHLPLGLDLKSNWSRAERPPEFLELFGNEGSVRGNPTLLPERSESWDAGLSWTLPRIPGTRARLEWDHYEQHARDMITYVRNSASSVRALNIARARIRGEELSARLELPRGLAASGWFTWQGTLDQGSVAAWHGRRLPQRPERFASAQLGWSSALFEASADLYLLGANFMDRANRMRVPSRTLTGVTLGVHPLPGSRIALEAKNLRNVQAADVAGFPLPGRSLYLSCEWDATSHARH